jgi:hypothetical protein
VIEALWPLGLLKPLLPTVHDEEVAWVEKLGVREA